MLARPGGVLAGLARATLLGAAVALASCTAMTPAPDLEAARAQVTAAERAFARSMAERNLDDFARHVSDEAVFFSGPNGAPLRGKAQVLATWSRYFEGPAAPFSWEPDEVEPLPSGTLAHSSGPVRNPAGQVVARFNSIWRLEAPGVWRVVFDKGSPLPAARPN